MKVYKIYPLGFASNSYFLTEDGVNAVCVDPARPRVFAEAEKRGLRVGAVLLTHGHFDHIGGCSAFQKAGAKIGCLAGEERLAVLDNLSETFGNGLKIQPFSIDFTVKNGEIIELYGMKIEVIATPGHTAGSATYRVGNYLFTGDMLFCGGVGRTDLPTGSGEALQNSLRKLFSLDGNYTVFAGHGEDTTLADERKWQL